MRRPRGLPSGSEIQAHCAANLAEYKRPRHIDIRDSLPMSAVGKILYRVLREQQAAAVPDAGDV